MHTLQLSSLMRLSWKIQTTRKLSRSKSVTAAWVIHQQADLMVYYLIKKHTSAHRLPETIANLTLAY